MAEVNFGQASQAPRPTRHKTKVVETAPWYRELWARISEGLKPGEATWVTLTDADRKEYKTKTLGRVTQQDIKKRLKKLGLHYTVERFLSDGTEIVQVWNEGPISKRDFEVREETTQTQQPTPAALRRVAGSVAGGKRR